MSKHQEGNQTFCLTHRVWDFCQEDRENATEVNQLRAQLAEAQQARERAEKESAWTKTQPMTGHLEHYRSCPELNPRSEEFCTCGLIYRQYLQTEQTMSAAWRKRAEEAEAERDALRGLLREAERAMAGSLGVHRPACECQFCNTLERITAALKEGE